MCSATCPTLDTPVPGLAQLLVSHRLGRHLREGGAEPCTVRHSFSRCCPAVCLVLLPAAALPTLPSEPAARQRHHCLHGDARSSCPARGCGWWRGPSSQHRQPRCRHPHSQAAALCTRALTLALTAWLR